MEKPPSPNKVIVEAFQAVSSLPMYRKRWICDLVWLKLVHSHYPDLKDLCDLARFKKALWKKYPSMQIFHPVGLNTSGVYSINFRAKCPIQSNSRNIHFYYVTDAGEAVDQPVETGQAFLLKHSQEVGKVGHRVSRNRIYMPELPVSEAVAADKKKTTADKASKRQRVAADKASKRQRVERHSHMNYIESLKNYWLSEEARNHFAPGSRGSLLEVIAYRMETLSTVISKSDGWRLIVENRDSTNMASEHDIWLLRQKAVFLRRLYQIAVEEHPTRTWMDCCQEAVSDCNDIGLAATISWKVLSRWHLTFKHRGLFPHPNPIVASGKKPLPPLLEAFPEVKAAINEFCRKNLEVLTADLLQDFIATKLQLPEVEAVDTQVRTILERYRARPPHPSTVLRWMSALGYHYSPKRKTYYVDGHEKPAQRFERKLFVTKYLELERRMYRWIQFPFATLQNLVANPQTEAEGHLRTLDLSRGYRYKEDDDDMIEFHVDENEYFLYKAMNDSTNNCGGWLSVRKDPNEPPVLLWGQDECVFHQHRYAVKQWVTPEGYRPLLPKSDGALTMISGFQSREFGFGYKLNPEQLQKVNQKRRGTMYKDDEAATEVLDRKEKRDLTVTPFKRIFDPGANDEGYWTYSHMAVQVEDCMDVCHVLWPEFHHVFMFDASSGHRKKRENGLDVSNMNKEYGGKQSNIRNSLIAAEHGYLGPYSPRLEQGDTQKMTFDTNDEGPFYLSEKERDEKRDDKVEHQHIETDKTKTDLIEELTRKGVRTPTNKHLNKIKKQDLVALANQHGIALKKRNQKIIEGWVGKPKGLLQVLWERGWIDEQRLDEYRLLAKDEEGEIIEELSLTVLMESCLDFANEKCRLEDLVNSYGMSVIMTPKYHAELAGCGIEYSWGAAKSRYRRIPHALKRSKKGFRDSVEEALSVLSVATIRKCDRKARNYVQAYYSLEVLGFDEGKKQTSTGETAVVSLEKIERFQKNFRTHRCAIDFDHKFCASLVTSEDTSNVQE